MDTVQSIKQRFEIIGNDPKLNRALEKAIQQSVGVDALKRHRVILPRRCGETRA